MPRKEGRPCSQPDLAFLCKVFAADYEGAISLYHIDIIDYDYTSVIKA